MSARFSQSIKVYRKKNEKERTGKGIVVIKKTGLVMVNVNGVKFRQNIHQGKYIMTREELNGVITNATKKRGTIIVTRRK